MIYSLLESRRNFFEIYGNKGFAFGNGFYVLRGRRHRGPSQAEGPLCGSLGPMA